ncbi:MAG: hypothetical protein ACRDPW_06260 [Mycobacteriales bacterium]
MIVELAADFANGPVGDVILSGPKSGNAIAEDIRKFVAPLAALIIGVMGIRYLVGDQRSLAGFIGFFLLGIVVYALIRYGNEILGTFSDILKSWF